MGNFKETVSQALENLASTLPVETSSSLLWGEVEMPECLRKELEEKKEK